jgi:hypothetical protein
MADISEIRLQYTDAKRMPTSVEGCQKTPTKTPQRKGQKENDCKAKPTLQGRKKEESFSEERNDGLPIVTTAEEQQRCSKLHSPAPKMRCGEVNSFEAPLAFPPPPQQTRCKPSQT